MAKQDTSCRSIDGVLVLDKPTGITSNRALQRVKYLLRARKAGHAGTLDPLASGVLPICLGEATKVSRFLLGADKAYLVEASLGMVTDTGDADGRCTSRQPVTGVTLENLARVLDRFRGELRQVPPMYSAIKIGGRPLYELARAGVEVQRQARAVTVFKLELLWLRNDRFKLAIECSKGTYVRTLIVDIGTALGCGAHVSALRRVRAGDFLEEQCITLDRLESLAANDSNIGEVLLPLDRAVQRIPKLPVGSSTADLLRQGQRVQIADSNLAGLIALYTGGQFFGVGEALGGGTIAPRRLLRAAG